MAVILSCDSPDAVLHSSQPYWLTLQVGFKAWALRQKNRQKPIETDILPTALIDRLRKSVIAPIDDIGALRMLGLILFEVLFVGEMAP